jgi:HEAT repeat protein
MRTGVRDLLDAIASRASSRDQLLAEASPDVVVEALRTAEGELARTVLCDALGRRHEVSAVEAIVDCLGDESARVRAAATDALAKIKDPRAGAPLLERLELPDPDLGVKRALIVALGAVDYRPAVPTLIEWLKCPDPSQRGGAAWSLGAMRAQEAQDPLKRALQREHSDYPRERILDALLELRKARSSTDDG